MQRDISRLSSSDYDVAIIGGGIAGICCAWDAALRGLRVALLERHDFSHGASANCFKMVHGGIRYLQHADVPRVRESCRERSVFFRIAPHLTSPLPIVIPTYGHGKDGKELLLAGCKVYDALTADRNRGIADPDRRIPPTRSISRAELHEEFPFLSRADSTGGVLFHDGQMYSPARLAMCFLLGATERGADAANYVRACRILHEKGRVVGVACRDEQTGRSFEVSSRVVINAAGGWAHGLLQDSFAQPMLEEPPFSRDACFLVDKPLTRRLAVAVRGGTRDPDAYLARSARHLFLAPWRGRTLVGVWHRAHRDDPENTAITETELQSFLDELNAACPDAALRPDDVVLTQGGLTLFGSNSEGAEHLSYGKRSLLVDHGRAHGMQGLISVIAVRYTVARGVADRAVRMAFRTLGRRCPPCETEATPVHGGDISSFSALTAAARSDPAAARFPEAAVDALVHHHGSRYPDVLRAAKQAAPSRGPDDAQVAGSSTLKAEVVHATDREMALHADDVVFRRTGLGTAGFPGRRALEQVAGIMGSRLGWDEATRREEVDRVTRMYGP